MKYEHRKIGEFCKVIGGYAFKSGDFTNVGVPVLKIKNISDKSLLLDSLDFLPERFLEIPDKYKVRQGDILISMTGSHITMPASAVGRVARSRCDEVFLLNQRVGKMHVDKRSCSLDYLYYCMTSAEFKEQIGLRSRGAANQANVSGGDIEGIEIPFPTLTVQQKIAGILAAYDDLIENNLKRIKLLEEMAQITYEEWFVRLRFPGHESTPINPETGLPEGWRIGTMQDLFDFKNGYAFKSGSYVQDGQHKIVTIKNVQDGSFIPDTTDRIAELPSNIKAHHKLSTGDIIMSLTGNVGRVCLVYGENYLLNQRVAKVVPNNPADRLYVYTLLRSRGTLTLLENISNGAAQQNLSPVNASKMPALVPTRSVLNDFNKSIGGIIDLICLKNTENQRLREARDILLPRLMTGVIDVESYNPSQFLKDAA